MIREDERLDDLLRAALTAQVVEAVPGPDRGSLRRVRERIAGAARRRRRRRLTTLAIAAAAAALAIVTSAAFATGVVRLNQPIVFVPQSVWMQHFQEEHHGALGKGSRGPVQPVTLAEAQRSVHFHVRALHGLADTELVRVTMATVTYRDGGQYPEVELDYAVGAVRVNVYEVEDANPKAPFEVPGQLLPTEQVVTIDGSQYLFMEDQTGRVGEVQFKTSDGSTMWVSFAGPRLTGKGSTPSGKGSAPSGKGSMPSGKGSIPSNVDPVFAESVIRHLT